MIMDKIFKNIIEETFKKKQRRKDRRLKMEKEFSEETEECKEGCDEEKKETDVDEIVDKHGNISRSTIPNSIRPKGITSKKTTDQVVAATMPQQGSGGILGGANALKTVRYWAESDMSKALGFDETMGKDKPLRKAKKYFKDDLGIPDDEAEDRLDALGYDEELPDEKVRLVENPKQFIKDYLEHIVPKNKEENDILEKNDESFEKKINPIIKRQLETLKKTMKSNKLNLKDISSYLK